MTALLAFDTAGERMTVAVAAGMRRIARGSAGGARASAELLPEIFALLDEAGLTLRELDAIAFGRGPGAFTGLRTACAVAQGLAFGAGKPVVPLDSLLAVAEDARAGAAVFHVWTLVDARMGQVYAGEYRHADGRWQTLTAPLLADPDALQARWRERAPEAVAGNALAVFGDRLDTGSARRLPEAQASGEALLELAARGWRDGAAVDAAEALPVYVRDKVADTIEERARARAAKG